MITTLFIIIVHNVMHMYAPILGITNQVSDCDFPMGTFLVIITVPLISSGSIAVLIATMILILVKKSHKSQSTSSVINSPIYEEPHHDINCERIALSDNIAYSMINCQEGQAV